MYKNLKFKISIIEVLSILSFLSLPIYSQTANGLTLAENGSPNFVIYYGAEESEIVEHAALELGQWFEELCGADFLATTDENTALPKIVIGRNNPLTEAISDEMNFDAIENDGFRILVHEGNLFVAGAIDRGTMYGVFYLLDNYFGIKWFSPEFAEVPFYANLEIDNVNDLQNPRFLYREIFSGDTDDAAFRQHNRLNGNRIGTHREYYDYPPEIDDWSRSGPTGSHNFQDIIGEVFHYGGQIEMMNEAVRSQAASYFITRIPDEGIEPWYMFAQEDNGWDADPESMDFAEAHGGALSAPIVDMVADIADRVRTTYPDAHMSTIAYQWSFSPPVGLTVPEYVMIEIAPIEANFGYPYNNGVENSEVYSAFTGWDQIASSLGVWDYNANFQNYLQPLPNIYPMFENIKYFAGMESFKSYFGEGAYNTYGAEFAELRAWVAARLLWNPSLDYHELINEFCDGYYGAASSYIKEYIALLHQSFENSGDRLSVKQRITSDYLNLNFILQADQLMKSAVSVVSGEYLLHAREVQLGVDMTILLREHMYAAEAEENGLVWTYDPERRSRFEAAVNDARITEYNEDSDIERLYAAMDIERVNPPKPDFIGDGTQWIDFQDMDFTYCCGAGFVEDEKASDHGAIAYDEGEWAVRITLDMLPPEGEWTLYAYVRIETAPGADPDADAFNLGIYPGTWITPKISEVSDGEYHLFEFPGMPVSYQTGTYAWFSVETPEIVENMYVDRIVAVNILTDVDDEAEKISRFDLSQNFPNPFNPSTKIKYSIPENSNVKLIVFNSLGEKVATIVNKYQTAGKHEANFNAENLSSGVYFYRLSVIGKEQRYSTKKMIILK